MTEDLQKEINRLGNLKQNKGKDSVTIEKLARTSLWKKQIDIKKRFTNKEDKIFADDSLNAYLENYDIQTFDQVQNIADLVFEEVIKHQTQDSINKILSDKSNEKSPNKLIETLHDIEDRIWKLKEKIGISSNKKKDDASALEQLKEKFKTYIPFNRNEFTLYAPYKCSGCNKEDIQPLLLRRRVKDFKVLKHPMFSGRFWYNRRGIEAVKQGLMSRELYAWLFYTSVQYVDWAIENEQTIVKIDGVEQAEIEKFITENPHLKETHIPQNILEEKEG